MTITDEILDPKSDSSNEIPKVSEQPIDHTSAQGPKFQHDKLDAIIDVFKPRRYKCDSFRGTAIMNNGTRLPDKITHAAYSIHYGRFVRTHSLGHPEALETISRIYADHPSISIYVMQCLLSTEFHENVVRKLGTGPLSNKIAKVVIGGKQVPENYFAKVVNDAVYKELATIKDQDLLTPISRFLAVTLDHMLSDIGMIAHTTPLIYLDDRLSFDIEPERLRFHIHKQTCLDLLQTHLERISLSKITDGGKDKYTTHTAIVSHLSSACRTLATNLRALRRVDSDIAIVQHCMYVKLADSSASPEYEVVEAIQEINNLITNITFIRAFLPKDGKHIYTGYKHHAMGAAIWNSAVARIWKAIVESPEIKIDTRESLRQLFSYEIINDDLSNPVAVIIAPNFKGAPFCQIHHAMPESDKEYNSDHSHLLISFDDLAKAIEVSTGGVLSKMSTSNMMSMYHVLYSNMINPGKEVFVQTFAMSSDTYTLFGDVFCDELVLYKITSPKKKHEFDTSYAMYRKQLPRSIVISKGISESNGIFFTPHPGLVPLMSEPDYHSGSDHFPFLNQGVPPEFFDMHVFDDPRKMSISYFNSHMSFSQTMGGAKAQIKVSLLDLLDESMAADLDVFPITSIYNMIVASTTMEIFKDLVNYSKKALGSDLSYMIPTITQLCHLFDNIVIDGRESQLVSALARSLNVELATAFAKDGKQEEHFVALRRLESERFIGRTRYFLILLLLNRIGLITKSHMNTILSTFHEYGAFNTIVKSERNNSTRK